MVHYITTEAYRKFIELRISGCYLNYIIFKLVMLDRINIIGNEGMQKKIVAKVGRGL